jgi:phosphomevalonate kinase
MTDQRREEHAKRLLNDELFNEAFDTLKTDLMERWHNSGSNESETRESLWLAIRLLDKVRGHVESIVETGHMAKILEKQHPFI